MIHHGNLFDVLPSLHDASIDACVTDGPYGIGFMNRPWDVFKPGTGATRKLMHPRESARARIASKNPNINGRWRSPALSPSQIDYDYTPAGLRRFQEFSEAWGREVFRVLKPGAYILSCGAPRAYHRMACGLEEAGFEIRDSLAWLFSSGFPKSLNFGCKCRGNAGPYSHAGLSTPERDVRRVQLTDVPETVNAGGERGQVLLDGLSKQSTSQRGAARPKPKTRRGEQSRVEGRELHRAGKGIPDDSHAGPSSSAGQRLRAGASGRGGANPRTAAEAGRGSAPQGPGPSEQRPRKSASLRLPSRTLDSGASDRGARCERCGGLTSARGLGTALKPAHEPIVVAWKPFTGSTTNTYIQHATGALNIDACRVGTDDTRRLKPGGSNQFPHEDDAWTPKTVTVGSDSGRWPANVVLDEAAAIALDEQAGRPVSGFYHVAKPSRAERDFGCEDIPISSGGRATNRKNGTAGLRNPRAGAGRNGGARNIHPTVKPIALMRWLVRLVTPPGGVVLDPFLGSGTTGIACVYEQRPFIGIEQEVAYVRIAQRRIAAVARLLGAEASA